MNMENQSFTTTILVDQTPKQVFDAINRPQDWWSGEIHGSSAHLNDEFTYQYKDLHMSKQKVVEFVPDEKVAWLVTDSSINYTEDKAEWTGTKIVFDISKHGDKTQVRFTHIGLHQEIECFDACSTTWAKLLQMSLFSLITTGKSEKLELA
jgi:hypothetical protein